ncbi:hypothetical protein MIND_01273300 [Mycena indigotica]|uniref:Uncharacterized protein n=1 Tax=Mycena indigotica TaxID=2126181 RepID=A0A8H6VX10_9AGAR|nr:uncharacterized protein MIND_01273300 [Mycena indigotica]KAF7291294.1 hypothetical protein MIND_01273300 [Mycena indigotica]
MDGGLSRQTHSVVAGNRTSYLLLFACNTYPIPHLAWECCLDFILDRWRPVILEFLARKPELTHCAARAAGQ